MRFFYVPGKHRPYWWINDEAGEICVGNKNDGMEEGAAKLSAADFHRLFPKAFEISLEQFESENVQLVDGIRWAALIKLVEKQGE